MLKKEQLDLWMQNYVKRKVLLRDYQKLGELFNHF